MKFILLIMFCALVGVGVASHVIGGGSGGDTEQAECEPTECNGDDEQGTEESTENVPTTAEQSDSFVPLEDRTQLSDPKLELNSNLDPNPEFELDLNSDLDPNSEFELDLKLELDPTEQETPELPSDPLTLSPLPSEPPSTSPEAGPPESTTPNSPLLVDLPQREIEGEDYFVLGSISGNCVQPPTGHFVDISGGEIDTYERSALNCRLGFLVAPRHQRYSDIRIYCVVTVHNSVEYQTYTQKIESLENEDLGKNKFYEINIPLDQLWIDRTCTLITPVPPPVKLPPPSGGIQTT